MSLSIPRRTYADLYGPTTGDRVRLADTELIVEVEKDFAAYGDESPSEAARLFVTAWGRVRARHAPRAVDRKAATGSGDHERAHHRSLGIVKGDIGIRDGRIVKVGKAGNPDTMQGVDPELVVGASTEVIAARIRLSPRRNR